MIQYIAVSEPVVGEGSATFQDSKNRVGRQLAKAILTEHDSKGSHLAPYNVFPTVINGNYSGTGSSKIVTLSVSDNVTIKAIFIWSETESSLYFRSDTMSNTKDVHGGEFYTSGITDITGNTFTLGTDSTINGNGVTYYYAALIKSGWIDSGSNLSPPAWIGTNIAKLGGASSTMANSVEKNLYEDKFNVEHTEAGNHIASIFDGISRIETGTFVSDGTNAQVIPLVDTGMDIKIFMVWSDTSLPAYIKTETMSRIKPLDNTVLSGSGFIALGTGQVTINSTVLLPLETVLDIPDGAAGTSIFTDDSSYNIPLLDSGYSFIGWSNDYPQSGTTSIKYSGGRFNSTSPIVARALSFTHDFNVDFYFRSGSSTIKDHRIFSLNPGLFIEIVSNVIVVKFGASSVITTTTALNNEIYHKITVKRINGFLSVEIDSVSEGGNTETYEFITPTTISIGYTSGVFIAGAYHYIDEIVITRIPSLFTKDYEYHYLAIGS